MSGYRSRLFGFSFLVCCCAATSCDDGGNKSCFENSDCQEGYVCRNDVCVEKEPSHCSNQLKDGDETDVDCGGSCAKCVNGKVCNAASDCENGQCENGRCTGEKALPAKPENLLINEVMGEPMTDETPFGYQTAGKQCDFVEIVNLLDQPQDLGGVTLVGTRTDRDDGFSVALEGRIAAKGAHVVLSCGLAPIEGVSTQAPSEDNFITAGSAVYDIQLTKDGEEPSAVFHWASTNAKMKGNSFNLNPDRDKNGETSLHSEVGEGVLNSPGYCANGGLFIQNCQTVCSNGVMDEGETDVDCGGSCRKCDLGKKCERNDDCRSGNCNLIGYICTEKPCTADKECADGLVCDSNDHTCKVPETCSDGIKNQDETDVDCGGTKCAKCGSGKACVQNSDCANNDCVGNQCSDLALEKAGVSDIFINEVMGSPKSGAFFDTQKRVVQCEFVEIVNKTEKTLDLNGLHLLGKKQDSTKADIDVELKEIIPSKGALVVAECNEMPLPPGSLFVKASLGITNDSSYTFSISDGNQEGSIVERKPVKTPNGKSQNRNPDRTDTDGVLVFHNEANDQGLNNSPGYCANGGLFTEDCAVVDLCKNGEKDGDETDVDCGGTKCSACGLEKACLKDGDCESGACDGGMCVVKKCMDDASCGEGKVCDVASGECRDPETCSDGKKNQDETDVDCGGEKCGACLVGKACKVNADCLSGICSAQVCTGEDPQKADVSKLYVNEVMGSPSDGNEYVEILNASGKKVSVDGLTLMLNTCGSDKGTTTCTYKNIKLEGIVDRDSFIVVSSLEISPLPDGSINLANLGKKGIIKNESSYEIYVSDGENDGPKAIRVPNEKKKGMSQNRMDEKADMTGVETLYLYEVLDLGENCKEKKIQSSPGYCANGGIYKYGCRVDASCNAVME